MKFYNLDITNAIKIKTKMAFKKIIILLLTRFNNFIMKENTRNTKNDANATIPHKLRIKIKNIHQSHFYPKNCMNKPKYHKYSFNWLKYLQHYFFLFAMLVIDQRRRPIPAKYDKYMPCGVPILSKMGFVFIKNITPPIVNRILNFESNFASSLDSVKSILLSNLDSKSAKSCFVATPSKAEFKASTCALASSAGTPEATRLSKAFKVLMCSILLIPNKLANKILSSIQLILCQIPKEVNNNLNRSILTCQ